MSETIHEILAALGRQMGIDGLGLDENLTCRLVFDDAVVVDMEYAEAPNTLFLYTNPAPLPIADRAEFYEKLLEANMFGQDTAGAVFAVNEVAGGIVLFYSLDLAGTDFEGFYQALETFVNTAEAWKDKLHSDMDISPKAPEPMPDYQGQTIIRG